VLLPPDSFVEGSARKRTGKIPAFRFFGFVRGIAFAVETKTRPTVRRSFGSGFFKNKKLFFFVFRDEIPLSGGEPA
jgi:hypothetical protein